MNWYFSSERQAKGGVSPQAEIIGAVVLIVLAVAVLHWRWVGFQGHDDASYADAALAWVEHVPALGTNHWALRYPLVLPAAGLIALFGPFTLALVAGNLFAYAAFLVTGYLVARHWFDWVTAVLLTLIYIVLPQFPVQATYANPDLLEMSFAVGSFWTLMRARERGGGAALLMLSGVLAGLGFLTRETSALLIILYGFLFLFSPSMPRWRYLLVGLGFMLVVGMQTGYFAAHTGDPFYRSRISAQHDTVDRGAKLAAAQNIGAALDSEGVLATSLWVAPLTAVFVSQKYGLLFFLTMPAYLILRRGGWMTRQQASVVDCAGLGALVAFLFVALNGSILYVVPRYFMVSAALAAVPIAVLAARWLKVGGLRRWLTGFGAAGFVSSCILLLHLENVRPLLAGERIVAFVATAATPVHVDPETLRRIRFLLLAAALQGRVTSEAPGPGALVASQDEVVNECLNSALCTYRARMSHFAPNAGWTQVQRFDPPRRMLGGVLDLFDLASRIPADIRRKIEQPGTGGAVYRTNL